ncbi:hypothetical protein J6590_024423 [Homalodisca vitripennis]|nr:hypothetical protein J6590_024423 [Homalodisca vitripennis]
MKIEKGCVFDTEWPISVSNTKTCYECVQWPRTTLMAGKLSILANGLLGLGSQGVPSTRAQAPILTPRPTILCSTRLGKTNSVHLVQGKKQLSPQSADLSACANNPYSVVQL